MKQEITSKIIDWIVTNIMEWKKSFRGFIGCWEDKVGIYVMDCYEFDPKNKIDHAMMVFEEIQKKNHLKIMITSQIYPTYTVGIIYCGFVLCYIQSENIATAITEAIMTTLKILSVKYKKEKTKVIPWKIRDVDKIDNKDKIIVENNKIIEDIEDIVKDVDKLTDR
jgi:hypothetical protein